MENHDPMTEGRDLSCLGNYMVKFIPDISFTQEQQDPEVKQRHSKRKHPRRWHCLPSSASRAYTRTRISSSSGACGRRGGEKRKTGRQHSTQEGREPISKQREDTVTVLLLPEGLEPSLHRFFFSDIWKVLQSAIHLGSVWPLNVIFQLRVQSWWGSEMFSWKEPGQTVPIVKETLSKRRSTKISSSV